MNVKANLQNGDLITYKNKEKKIILGGELCSVSGSIRCLYGTAENLIDIDDVNECDIIKVERPVKYETVYERKEILDTEEKEYLSAVIKPFRNKVEYIKKRRNGDKEYIMIGLDDESLYLPYFKEGTMYRGMELYEEYTLEELEL